MKKIINICLLLVFAATSLISCDDFLQKDPTAVPSQSVFWKKKSDFESGLAGVYSVLYNSPFSARLARLEGMTDNCIQSDLSIILGDLTPNTGDFVKDIYNNCYVGIARLHTVLHQLDIYEGSDISPAEEQFMRAQCYMLRAYFYTWLYQCYREVPLVTDLLSVEDMYHPKASREEIRKQIIEDYDYAIANLPDKLYTDEQMIGRFTASAAKALKARFLLFDAYDNNGNAIKIKMTEIVQLLQSIKNYSVSSLMPRTRDNFLNQYQDKSAEIMFSIKYMRPNLTHNMDQYYGGWYIEMPTQDLIDAFECTDGKKWSESPMAVKPDVSIIYDSSLSTEERWQEREKFFINRDERLIDAVVNEGTTNYVRDGWEDKLCIVHHGNTVTGYCVKKLIQPMDTPADYGTISDQDVVILRYAHVLLMLAEAENEANGPTSVALNAVNAIRARSHQPEIEAGISQDELRERIRNEWRVETCFEGLRYFQLKRWKLMDKLVNGAEDPAFKGYVKVYKPAFEFFPIPQAEIDKAGGILVQDPNYQ